MTGIIPDSATRMELLVVSWVLRSIRFRIDRGEPAEQVIDEAINECLEKATAFEARTA